MDDPARDPLDPRDIALWAAVVQSEIARAGMSAMGRVFASAEVASAYLRAAEMADSVLDARRQLAAEAAREQRLSRAAEAMGGR